MEMTRVLPGLGSCQTPNTKGLGRGDYTSNEPHGAALSCPHGAPESRPIYGVALPDCRQPGGGTVERRRYDGRPVPVRVGERDGLNRLAEYAKGTTMDLIRQVCEQLASERSVICA